MHSTRYDRTYSDITHRAPAILVIDSRQRDNINKTEPNKYTITLKKPYNDVVAAELIQFYGYNSNYNIDTGYDTLHMKLGTAPDAPDILDSGGNPQLTEGDEIIIPHGLYNLNDSDPNDIKQALDLAMTNFYYPGDSVGTANFTIQQDPASKRLIFSASVPFSFYFNGGLKYSNSISIMQRRNYRENTIGQVLGFKPANYQSVYDTISATYQIVSDYPPNLELDRYITMHILGFERVDSTNDKIQSAFAIIPLVTADPSAFTMLQTLNCIESEAYIHYFPEPRKVHRLNVEFRDFAGNLYDFRGQPHVFTLKLYECGSGR